MPQTVLVTGGTGYIGSHTVVELIEKGFTVKIVDNLSNSKISVLEGIEAITGMRPQFDNFDLTDKEILNDYLSKNDDIDAVIHFAALKAVGESVEKPLAYYRNNLFSLINILEGMEKYFIPNIVFSSSCTVYGQPDQLPVRESSPIKKAISPYGNTKQIAEEIISDTVKSSDNLKAISLRYFNPIGAHKTALIGELPLGVPDNLVPYVTQTAIGIREQLRIFGNDYNTPDGTAIRDYIDVVDLSKAHVVAIDRLMNKKNKDSYEVFNLGTGKGLSVLEVVKTFETATGVKLNYKFVDRRPGDIEAVWADTKFANEELGWNAVVPIEKTMKSAWAWEKNYRKKEKTD